MIREVAYRLKVDGKAETKRAFAEVGEAGASAGKVTADGFAQAGTAAEAAALRATAAQERQMAAWTVQASKAREIQNAMARNASFDAILGVGGLRKSAEESAKVFEEAFAGGLTRLQRSSRVNLTRQAADVFTMAAMGASPAMIGVSQGPQVIDAWATSGIKLNATMLATAAALGGVGIAAGALALVVKREADAWNAKVAAQRDAVAVSDKLALLNQQLANASSAMAPVLLAEAAALQAKADASYRSAAADRDRLRIEAELSGLGGDGDRAVAGFARANQMQGVVDQKGVDAFNRSVETTRTKLRALATDAKAARDQLDSGFDAAGRALSAGSRADLSRTLANAMTVGQTEALRLKAQRDRFLSAGNASTAKDFASLQDDAERLLRDARGPQRATAGSGSAPAVASATARALAEVRDVGREIDQAERERLDAMRQANGLTDIRLGFALKLAQISNEGIDLLEREIYFRQLVAQLTGQGLDAETARPEAARQVRLEAEAEARVRGRTPEGFTASAAIMEAVRAKLGDIDTNPLTDKLQMAGAYFGDALRDGMMAAAHNDNFFAAFKERLGYTITSAFADRASAGLTDLLFGKKDGGGGLISLGLKALGGIGHNARGTANWRGGLSWVGEQGPELLDIPAGSRVMDAGRSAAVAGGGVRVSFDLRGAVMTSDLLRQMESMAANAANGAERRAVSTAAQQAGPAAHDYLDRNSLLAAG